MGLGALLGIGAIGLAGCSAAGSDSAGAGGANAGGSGQGATGSGATGAGGTINITGGTNGAGGTGLPAGCGGDVYKAEGRELDMYIMMDRSGSMLIPFVIDLWTPIGSAIGQFVTLPEAAGIGVGIQFFGDDNDSCDPNVYAQPAAGIGPLPGNAGAIQQAIVNNTPLFGETPTLPAEQGAIQYARGWAQAWPAHKVIVVLATDGEPNKCNSTAASVSQAAADGLNGTPSIPTYVIGIGNIASLNQIAQAGGTGQALIVAADPAVASQQFVDAMNAIRGIALPCDYAIPSGGAPNKVNLSFDEGSGPAFVPNVGSAQGCDPAAGGWYYDNPSAPQRILTCTATCDLFKSKTNGQVNVVVGCDTVVK
jgi:hypothetical protein